MKFQTIKKTAFLSIAFVALFVGAAWVTLDVASVSFNDSSISADASASCGGCGNVTIWFGGGGFNNDLYHPNLDGGGGGGGYDPTPSCTLEALPGSTINQGESVTLSWSMAFVSSASIDNGIGSVPTIGTKVVSPSVTTTYKLTGNGAYGGVVCQKTVVVTPPPTPVCSADLSKDTLIWSTVNATSVTIISPTGSPAIPSPQALSGSYNFVPQLGSGTHSYNLTATGPGGSVLCAVTVTITPQPAPTCTLSANPTAITTGGSSTLSWTTTNTSSVSINQGIGGVTANGSTSVSPTSSKVYTLTATGPGGTVTCAQGITVTPPPVPVCTLDFSATNISWATTNTSSVTIVSTTGSPTVPSPGLNGSYAFSPVLSVGTHSYTLTATGAGGSVICQGTIHVDPLPSAPSCTLTATPSTISPGGSSTLAWTTTNASTISINQGVGTVSVANGAIIVAPSVTKTYTLTATGAGGTVTCEKTITVTTSSVPVCSLDLSKSSISWTTTNATSITITPTTASPAIPTPLALSGSYNFSPHLGVGTHTYSLTATGPGGSVLCGSTVTVTPNPTPSCVLSANPSSVLAGDASALSWTTTNAVSATINHSVGAITPIASGSTAVSVPSTRTYTMTVTNSFGDTATCQTIVTVVPPSGPACTISLSRTSITSGQSINVSWTSVNATSGTITGGVGAVSPVSSGSAEVFPSSDTTFTGTFTGPSGTVNCSATVTVGTAGCTSNCGGGYNPPNVVLYKQPINQPLAFVSLAQIPYTGFAAGPVLTVLFWLAIGLFAAIIAYAIAGRGGIRYLYSRFNNLPVANNNNSGNHSRTREHMYGTSYPSTVSHGDDFSQNDASVAPRYETETLTPLTITPAPLAIKTEPIARQADISVAAVKAVDGIPAIADVIESRAHASGVLMSPESVLLASEYSSDRAETLLFFGEILNEAVRTIPRENGWIMLTAERFSQLVDKNPKKVTSSKEDTISISEVLPQVKEFTIDDTVASAFAKAVLKGDRTSAFSIIRSLEHDGVRPTSLMTSTATVLDTLYRARHDNKTPSDLELAEAAKKITDDELARLVTVFTHSLDAVYSSPFTGVKLALAQAFEVVG
ncbi:hypothetical protein EPO56_01715 [Patescibacteria group bacterium]|nr:MAG: hypothetical protein EPO56_01715 [Patescibacteria group bacterium]